MESFSPEVAFIKTIVDKLVNDYITVKKVDLALQGSDDADYVIEADVGDVLHYTPKFIEGLIKTAETQSKMAHRIPFKEVKWDVANIASLEAEKTLLEAHKHSIGQAGRKLSSLNPETQTTSEILAALRQGMASLHNEWKVPESWHGLGNRPRDPSMAKSPGVKMLRDVSNEIAGLEATGVTGSELVRKSAAAITAGIDAGKPQFDARNAEIAEIDAQVPLFEANDRIAAQQGAAELNVVLLNGALEAIRSGWAEELGKVVEAGGITDDLLTVDVGAYFAATLETAQPNAFDAHISGILDAAASTYEPALDGAGAIEMKHIGQGGKSF